MLGSAIRSFLPKPDVALISPATSQVGFVHRKLPGADIYFVANTDNRPHAFDATFRGSLTNAEWWDPFSGKDHGRGFRADTFTSTSLLMNRAWLSSRSMPRAGREAHRTRNFAPIDLTHDWK